MRTKALLCAAALAAGAATSMAQNVYSLNVVGYINLTLTNGLNLIANQLDADGTMTNNYTTNIFSTNLPTGSRLYAFSPAAGQFSGSVRWTGSGWVGVLSGIDPSLDPGKGLFVQVAGTTPITLTLVGQVIQGTNSVPLVQGLQIVSSIPPIAGGIQTTLGYTPTVGDRVYQWSALAQGYAGSHRFTGSSWIGGEPSLAIGEGVFLQSATTTNWVQAFTVQ